MRHFSPKQRTPLRAIVESVGADWRKVGGPLCSGNPGGPEWDVRVLETGRLYRIGDFTYQRMLRHNAEPTPEGWQEIDEDGNPIEGEAAQ